MAFDIFLVVFIVTALCIVGGADLYFRRNTEQKELFSQFEPIEVPVETTSIDEDDLAKQINALYEEDTKKKQAAVEEFKTQEREKELKNLREKIFIVQVKKGALKRAREMDLSWDTTEKLLGGFDIAFQLLKESGGEVNEESLAQIIDQVYDEYVLPAMLEEEPDVIMDFEEPEERSEISNVVINTSGGQRVEAHITVSGNSKVSNVYIGPVSEKRTFDKKKEAKSSLWKTNMWSKK